MACGQVSQLIVYYLLYVETKIHDIENKHIHMFIGITRAQLIMK